MPAERAGAGPVRAFVALPCPPALRAALADALAGWRGLAAGVRWADPHRVHLTLRFLGRATPAGIERLTPALGAAAGACPPLELAPAATGAFPGWSRPRVFWLGVEGGPALAGLAAAVEAGARRAGFEPEPRDFTPHLTLGRVKGPNGVRRATAAVRGWRPTTAPETVSEVVLYRSDLGDGGPRYTPLARYALNGSPGGTGAAVSATGDPAR
ncbi:MAG TPA: RNA 2',3'-cyclic phosphodiesterase [Gemmatimonadota bacterium]|nr:RNA 2',3'-cyclic phosphodiesterase [Gemmatimonadota bacterium]